VMQSGVPVMPGSSGPSEFTRVLGRVQAPGPVMPPAPTLPAPPRNVAPTPVIAKPAEPEPERTTKSYWPLIIALNVILIVAVVLIVFVFTRK
jgi:hypothetical protein